MMTRRTMKTLAMVLLLAMTFFAGVAYGNQWRMIDARDSLQTALGYLQAAEADKGGYRVQAIASVNQAIAQVNAGIAAGR